MEFFLCVIGMVMFVEGTPWFLCPEKFRFLLSQVLDLSESALRSLGLALMFTGLLIIYTARQLLGQ